MKRIFASLMLCVFSTGCLEASEKYDPVLSVSATVVTPGGRGSGTLFYKNCHMYVLTCGHVAEGLFIKEVDGKRVYKDADIVQTKFHKGKVVAEIKYKAEVVLSSPPEEENGIDLALLRVKWDKVGDKGALIDRSVITDIGDDIVHVGTLFGRISQCLVKGHIGRLDYYLDEFNNSPFTVTVLESRPGSSGGGIFQLNAKGEYVYVGMLVRGDRSGISLIKPFEVIDTWLKDNHLDLWSDTVPEVINKIPTNNIQQIIDNIIKNAKPR